MLLRSIALQHFRSYSQAKFDFDPHMTVIIGPNTAGKTNLTEAIQLLSSGKSFRGQSDSELVQFGQEIGRVQGLVEDSNVIPAKAGIYSSSTLSKEWIPDPSNSAGRQVRDDTKNGRIKLEVVILTPNTNNGRFGKKFLVNGVGKSRNNFVGHLPVVVFRPEELDIVIEGPSLRRQFLDDVMQTVDREYYLASIAYEKALRQRNALLRVAQDSGYKNPQQFEYWDEQIIENGSVIHEKRKKVIDYLNQVDKDIFQFEIVYDHSIVSLERLAKYSSAEIASGVTLVGPHRDDFYLTMEDTTNTKRDIKTFGSRGQQRLVVLQLKLLQIRFVELCLRQNPLLVMDDIFSELDTKHIELVLEKTRDQQVILTTTHKEFLSQDIKATVIELER